MPKFITTMVVEGTQWFKNGDHPRDNREMFMGSDGVEFLGEGKIVRYFRHPSVPGDSLCELCNMRMHDHGFIDRSNILDQGLVINNDITVCPGDWVITHDSSVKTCKPEYFKNNYFPYDEHGDEQYRLIIT